MPVYEQAQTIHATADDVFAFVSDVDNLPKFMPTTKRAELTGESFDGAPELHVEGSAQGHEYAQDGFLRTFPDRTPKRMEWGAQQEDRYSGFLTVDDDGDTSRVTIHLEFGPNSLAPEAPQQEAPGDRDPMEASLSKSLLSIQNLVEGRGGPVMPREED